MPITKQKKEEIVKELEEKLDKVYKSTESTRKYILAMLVISVVVIVLPLIGFIFIIPQFLSIYSGLGSDLGL